MKIMAIDYGDAHTGIAISDYTETLAGYSDTIHSRRQEEVLSGIQRLIAEHGVQLLVLGYPRNMDGTEGPRAEKCAAFGALLRQVTGLEVILWDERRTTIDAHNILFQNGQNAKKRKKTVDAVAAAALIKPELFANTPLLVALNPRLLFAGYLERALPGTPQAVVSAPVIANPSAYLADAVAGWQRACEMLGLER